jgi:hypothetical protein
MRRVVVVVRGLVVVAVMLAVGFTLVKLLPL